MASLYRNAGAGRTGRRQSPASLLGDVPGAVQEAVAGRVAGLGVLGEGVERLALVGPLLQPVVAGDDRPVARRPWRRRRRWPAASWWRTGRCTPTCPAWRPCRTCRASCRSRVTNMPPFIIGGVAEAGSAAKALPAARSARAAAVERIDLQHSVTPMQLLVCRERDAGGGRIIPARVLFFSRRRTQPADATICAMHKGCNSLLCLPKIDLLRNHRRALHVHHEATLIATIAIGFVLAFGFGYVADRLRLPPLVGYLLAGILIGPLHAGLRGRRRARRPARRDRRHPADVRRRPAFLAVRPAGRARHRHPGRDRPDRAGDRCSASALCSLWGWSLGTGLVLGLSLSVASTVVLLKALEERNLVDSRNGRVAVGWLIVEDLAMVLALVLLPAFAEMLGGKPVARPRRRRGMPIALELAITLAKVAAFAALAILLGPRVVPWLLARVARTGSRELFTLSVLAVALGIAYGSAQLFGVSFALGAFFAGVVLSESVVQPQGGRRLAAAAGRLLGAVLRLGRHAVRSDDPDARARRGAGGAGADHRRQVADRLRHRHAAALSDQHRPHGVGQPGADRRVLLHPDRARHLGRPGADRGPRPGGGRRAVLDHAQPAGLLRRSACCRSASPGQPAPASTASDTTRRWAASSTVIKARAEERTKAEDLKLQQLLELFPMLSARRARRTRKRCC